MGNDRHYFRFAEGYIIKEFSHQKGESYERKSKKADRESGGRCCIDADDERESLCGDHGTVGGFVRVYGDPESSFPPSLKLVPDIMDRVMDIRSEGNDVRKMMALEETELLKVISGITGCPLALLQKEHKLRKYGRVARRAFTTAAVFFTVSAVSLGLMNLAQNYRDKAQAAEETSMQILQELTYSLPDRLSGVPGAYATLADILRENAVQINDILLLSQNKQRAKYEVAVNYEKLATALTTLGDYSEAAENEGKAIELYDTLLEDPDYENARISAKNNLARIYTVSGDYSAAEKLLEEAIAQQRERNDPMLLASLLSNAGANALETGDYEKAEKLFAEAEEQIGEPSGDYDAISVLADTRYNHGLVLQRRGDYSAAEVQFRNAMNGYTALCEQTDSVQNRTLLVKTASALALCLTDEGVYAEAGEYFEAAIAVSEELAADRENHSAVSSLASLYNNYGLCFNTQGNYKDAADYYEKAVELYGELYRVSTSAYDGAIYATTLINLGETEFKLGDYAVSAEHFERGLEIYAPVCEQLGSYYMSEYYSWKAYYELVHLKDFDRAVDSGITAWQYQNDSVLANMVLGYACLYNGYWEDADALLGAVAALGSGQLEMMENDLASQKVAGLESAHTEELLALLRQSV